jgi:hypothetical protein
MIMIMMWKKNFLRNCQCRYYNEMEIKLNLIPKVFSKYITKKLLLKIKHLQRLVIHSRQEQYFIYKNIQFKGCFFYITNEKEGTKRQVLTLS